MISIINHHHESSSSISGNSKATNASVGNELNDTNNPRHLPRHPTHSDSDSASESPKSSFIQYRFLVWYNLKQGAGHSGLEQSKHSMQVILRTFFFEQTQHARRMSCPLGCRPGIVEGKCLPWRRNTSSSSRPSPRLLAGPTAGARVHRFMRDLHTLTMKSLCDMELLIFRWRMKELVSMAPMMWNAIFFQHLRVACVMSYSVSN